MSHFGSVQWNNPCGLVGSLAATGVSTPPTSGTLGVREGTDLFTFAVPRAGQYRVSSYIKVTAVGTGAGNNLIANIAYNDGAAVASANILPTVGLATPTAATNVTTAGSVYQQTTVYCAAGTNIVCGVMPGGTVTTTGTMNWYVSIEAL